MAIPQTNFSPAFNTTRASHVVLTTRDLPHSRDFYTEVIGLVVTDETPFEIHLRGLEESGHHSLVLRKSGETPVCERIGFRVFQDEDLDRAKEYFDRQGIAARWAERAYQLRTLEVNDPSGIPLEFCFGMPTQPRLHAATGWTVVLTTSRSLPRILPR